MTLAATPAPAPPVPRPPDPVTPRPPRRARRDFLAKSIAGVAEAVERAVFTEEYARRPGLLQRLDPRAKLVGLLLLVLTAALVRHAPVLAVLYAATLALARLSHLPLGFFVRRVWLGIPLFAGVVILPALLTMPGRDLLGPLELGPLRLGLTDRSLTYAAVFLLRVGTSVSLAVLLVVTTPWAHLLGALRVLGVPGAFTAVLGMTYRYIFILLRLVADVMLARRSRTVGRGRGAEQRRWVATSMGALMGRSIKLSHDVHLARRARGFRGAIRTLDAPAMADADWLFVAAAVALAAGALLLDIRLR